MKVWLSLLALILVSTCGYSQGTLFHYQGQLQSSGTAAQGNFDFSFTLYDANTNGNVIGANNLLPAVALNNGLFSVGLDFGPVFTGSNYWLEIGVRGSGSTNNFTTLAPRQPVTPVPYAIFANAASNLLGTLNAAQLSGTVPSAQLTGNYLNPVNFTNGLNSFVGKYFGNGLYLTNLNGSLISTGTVADARLSTNVALLNTNQIFTGNNSFLGINQFPGPGNNFNGAFSGNGAALTNLNGTQVTFGTVADARLSSNVPLLNTNQVFTGSNTFNGNGYFTGANIFTNRNNSFIGSFFGNGLVGWIPVSGTSTQAMSDAGYLLTNSLATTVTLPPSPLVGDIVRISGAGAGGWKVALNSGQRVAGNFYSYVNSLWLPASVSASSYWISVASSASGQIMYAAVQSGSIFSSTDYGQTWSPTSANTAQWQSLACSADGKIVTAVASSASGSIYYSTNTGVTWKLSVVAASNWGAVSSSADGTRQVAVVNGGGIFTSTNYGSNWIQSSTAPAKAWYSVASSASGSNVIAAAQTVGSQLGGVYTSPDFGATWTLRNSVPANSNWVSVASSSDGTRLTAAILGGGVYTSSDSGNSWTLQSGLPTNTNWFSVASSSDGLRLAAVVHGGGIYTSGDGGVSWTRQLTAPTLNWVSVASSADGSKLAAVIYNNDGTIYYSTSTGQSVTSTNSNATISGSQGSAVELQYIGKNQWMPVSSAGKIWAN